MALIIKHAFVSSKTDGQDDSVVRPSNWNESHIIIGGVDETMFSFTDITTANASTLAHGLLPKLPNDAALFLDGTGNFSTPLGSGTTFDLTVDHSFSGTNNFSGKTHLGAIPSCDFAQVTVYQTMDGTQNTSMMDVVVSGQGDIDMVGLLVLSHSIGNLATQTSLYVRADNNAGSVGNAYGIRIDSPIVDAHISTSYGLQINNQLVTNQSAAFNLYSSGFTSVNVFEGSVGVGTTSPQSPLEVVGAVRANSAILQRADDGVTLTLTAKSGGQSSNLVEIKNSGGNTVVAVKPSGEVDAAGLQINQQYIFPTTAGAAGQVMVTDGSGNLTWNTISDSPITTSFTDQRVLVNLSDSTFGAGYDLRVLRIGGSFKNSSQGPSTTWFTLPQAPSNDSNDYVQTTVGASISFFAYYSLHNPNINTNGWFQGMTKGHIEFLTGWSAVETSADQTNNGAVMTFSQVSNSSLQFNFLGQWNDPNTICNVTIHFVSDVFTSPEYYC